MQNLPTIWLRDKTPKEQEAIKELLKHNTLFINEFLSVLDKMESEELRKETTESQYDNPSWAYKQADSNGARRAYRKIRALFNMETTH